MTIVPETTDHIPRVSVLHRDTQLSKAFRRITIIRTPLLVSLLAIATQACAAETPSDDPVQVTPASPSVQLQHVGCHHGDSNSIEACSAETSSCTRAIEQGWRDVFIPSQYGIVRRLPPRLA